MLMFSSCYPSDKISFYSALVYNYTSSKIVLKFNNCSLIKESNKSIKIDTKDFYIVSGRCTWKRESFDASERFRNVVLIQHECPDSVYVNAYKKINNRDSVLVAVWKYSDQDNEGNFFNPESWNNSVFNGVSPDYEAQWVMRLIEKDAELVCEP